MIVHAADTAAAALPHVPIFQCFEESASRHAGSVSSVSRVCSVCSVCSVSVERCLHTQLV